MSNVVEFTKQMKKEYTILVPDMAPVHFKIIMPVFIQEGYHVELLDNQGSGVVNSGLKYVHNDTCYPALLVIGQMIDALNSGRYDVKKVALMITQTGGGCRASNYIHLLRKALVKAGYGYIPVISLNMSGLEKNSGFKLTLGMLRKAIAGMVYGDLIMHLANQCRPYEIDKGSTDALVDDLTKQCAATLNANKGYSIKQMKAICKDIVEKFASLPLAKITKPKVGIVGEIYVKYAPLGNNNLEKFLQTQDVEYMVPGLMGFALFKVDNRLEDIKLYGGNMVKKAACKLLFDYLEKMEGVMADAVKKYSSFVPIGRYAHTKELVKDIVGYGFKMGEGWLLTAEIMELCDQGYENVVCTQPFGCLPNHINGKGMIRKITNVMPNANIVAIDYDPSATKVNQENRIKLMLSIAKEKLNG